MSTQSAFTQFAQANGGLAEERQRFAELQTQLVPIFRDIFPERVAPQTVIIVPSASVDSHVLAKVSGAHHYEERLLCLLILLRLPRTKRLLNSCSTVEAINQTEATCTSHLGAPNCRR